MSLLWVKMNKPQPPTRGLHLSLRADGCYRSRWPWLTWRLGALREAVRAARRAYAEALPPRPRR